MSGYSVYLTPTTPAWAPTSEEEDLRSACEGGLLEENHFFEAKRDGLPWIVEGARATATSQPGRHRQTRRSQEVRSIP